MAEKKYVKKFDLVESIRTLDYGETLEITDDDFNFSSIPTTLKRLRERADFNGYNLVCTRDSINRICYVTRFREVQKD